MSDAGTRRLATVLFTDMVGSTEVAAKLGDARWRELLRRHHQILRRDLKRFGGREIDTAGDGLFAIFGVPAQAVRCACAIAEETQQLGVDIRAGLHVGEVEIAGKEVRGIAVHTGSRLCAAGGPTDVLVTSTLTELVGGAGIEFEDRGLHAFKGVPGEWRMLNVTKVSEAIRPAPLDPAIAEERLALIEPPPFVHRRRGWIGAGVAVASLGLVALALATRSPPKPKPPPAPLNSVVRIDPSSGAVVQVGARDLPLNGNVIQLRIGEGGVWLLASRDVFRLDPSTGSVQTSIPSVDRFGIGRGAIWVSNALPIKLTVLGNLDSIDPATGSVLTSAPGVQLLTASPRAVWGFFHATIAKIDPGSGRPAGTRFRYAGPVDDAVVSADALWIADSSADSLTRHDLQTGRTTSLPLAATPDRIVAGGGYIWSLDRVGGTVTVVDATTSRAITVIRVGAHPTDLSFGAGTVWVSDGVDGTITRIDAATRQSSRIQVGVPIEALAFDSSANQIWLAVGTPVRNN